MNSHESLKTQRQSESSHPSRLMIKQILQSQVWCPASLGFAPRPRPRRGRWPWLCSANRTNTTPPAPRCRRRTWEQRWHVWWRWWSWGGWVVGEGKSWMNDQSWGEVGEGKRLRWLSPGSYHESPAGNLEVCSCLGYGLPKKTAANNLTQHGHRCCQRKLKTIEQWNDSIS